MTPTHVGRRAALVTGASRGIGLGIARGLADAGYDLTVSARDAARLEKSAGALADAGGRVHRVPADMAVEDDVRRLAAEHAQHHGRLDVLVIGAGVGSAGALEQTTTKRYDLQFAVNVRAPFVLLQHSLPLLRKTAAADPERGSKVIALSSITGVAAEPDLAAYGAAKAALISLCRSVNSEASAQGVCATAICPGYVDTDMSAHVRDRIDPSRMIRIEDVVELALSVTRLSACAVVPEIVVTRPGDQLWRA
ncbi:SDR family NAD(P)-dependent oxidoreductase [Streptomyces brasiliensis]|uniref:NAD(P)-dependent oxidoreductase n=1 Tax=Streptomyces brasiliensis TaxID=1954 RepID=A0A917NWK5_9ACTN|nr:SDR family oxidoreductase [Streptomyces brasiliensis]GGJ35134.1 NAD(P)-dependent oxidoreductase [Streptomyces brasiliensis]